jgi:Trk-type K+ transport system membrane component
MIFLSNSNQRAHIDNDEQWFGVFEIIFELTSAYGTVGLSLGLPTVSLN